MFSEWFQAACEKSKFELVFLISYYIIGFFINLQMTIEG